MITTYPACFQNIVPLNLVAVGGLVFCTQLSNLQLLMNPKLMQFNGRNYLKHFKVTGYEENGKPDGNIRVANEKADSFPVLDYMRKGLWYMFQITMSSCYKSTLHENYMAFGLFL